MSWISAIIIAALIVGYIVVAASLVDDCCMTGYIMFIALAIAIVAALIKAVAVRVGI